MLKIFLTKNSYLLFLVLLVFALGSIPYIAAYSAEDSEHIFSGYLLFPEDMDSYQAFANQSKNGSWLFHNPYDYTKPSSSYLNTFWLATGKLMSLFGLSFKATFQFLRLFSIILLLFSLQSLLKAIKIKKHLHPLIISVFALGGGFGWLFYFVGHKTLSPDLYTELFPFIQSSFVPHTALAHAFVLYAFSLIITAEQNGDNRKVLEASIVALILGSFRIYDMLILYAVATCFYLLLMANRPSLQRAKRMLMVLTIPLPAIIYTFWLTNFAPGFSVWSNSNHYPAPEISTLLIAVGFWWIPALIFMFVLAYELQKKLKSHQDKFVYGKLLVATWIICAWILMLSGLLPFAWRTCATFITPILLASVFLLQKLISSERALKLVLTVLLLLSLPSSFVFIDQKYKEANEQILYYFQPPEVIEAIHWLDLNHKNKAVLTHGHIGLKLPAYSQTYSLLGHKDLTDNFKQKKKAYFEFGNAKNKRIRIRALKTYDVDLVFWSPLDRRFAAYDPAELEGLEEIFSNSLVTVFKNNY